MKKWNMVLLVILAVLLLSGCSIGAVTDLYCLPMRSEEFNNLQSVMNSAMVGLEYSAPLRGDNRQTVQQADLNGDGEAECLVFAKGTADKPLQILVFSGDGAEYTLLLDLQGEYQSNNIRTACAALDVLHCASPLTIPRRALLAGLRSVVATTHLKGRWQVLSREPLVVCDTGHNAHGIKYVARRLESLASHYDKLYCIVGFAKDKALGEVLPLLPKSANYIFTEAASPRAMKAEALKERAGEFGLQGVAVDSVAGAIAYAKGIATAADAIFIGGSNFVVGEIPEL